MHLDLNVFFLKSKDRQKENYKVINDTGVFWIICSFALCSCVLNIKKDIVISSKNRIVSLRDVFA